MHVFDVATGKEGKDVVAQADGVGNGECLAWKRDGSGFFYTRAAREADAPKDGVHQRVYFHKLGEPLEKDVLAVGKDSPAIAQWEIALAEDGQTIVARMEYGDGGEFEQWLLGRSGKWTQVATKMDDVRSMDVGPDRALYLLSVKDAPKGKILRTSLASPSLDKAEVIAPEGDGVIEEFLPLKSRVYVVEDVGGPSRSAERAAREGEGRGKPATITL